jgi:hypothetical protein
MEEKEDSLPTHNVSLEGDNAIILKIAVVAFLCVCAYFAGKDVLLLFWGKHAVGTMNRDIPLQGRTNCHWVLYTFSNDTGTKYENSTCYPCSGGGGRRVYGSMYRTPTRLANCVRARSEVEVTYVSWNPDINKASYDLLDNSK